ncbi:MAG: tRNA lysidine(34) synthetase TilS [Deltaproteobacteria bacterium]|nr:tRNA lysidine(34) synthetase TilS [Deltaproteobacteria bacterium]
MSSTPDVIKKFREAIRAFSLLTRGDKVLIALSGGPDSVVLTHLLGLVRRELGLSLSAIHINHALRGEESEREAVWVRGFCQKLGIPLTLKKLFWPAGKRSNLQEKAREKRYRAFLEVAEKEGAHKVATAHHADDQMETVLMRFLQGAGIEGLSGIPVKRTLGQVTLIRPLIFLTKKEILTYARQNKLKYKTDSSNLKDKYWRNSLRLVVIPKLLKVNPTLSNNITRMTLSLRRDSDLLNEVAGETYDRLAQKGDRSVGFVLDPFMTLPPAIQIRLFKKGLEEIGPGIRGLSHHLERMLDLAANKNQKASYALPGGRYFEKEDGFLRIFAATKNGRAAAILMNPDEVESWRETLAVRQDHALMREIRRGLKGLARAKKTTTLNGLF